MNESEEALNIIENMMKEQIISTEEVDLKTRPMQLFKSSSKYGHLAHARPVYDQVDEEFIFKQKLYLK